MRVLAPEAPLVVLTRLNGAEMSAVSKYEASKNRENLTLSGSSVVLNGQGLTGFDA